MKEERKFSCRGHRCESSVGHPSLPPVLLPSFPPSLVPPYLPPSWEVGLKEPQLR